MVLRKPFLAAILSAALLTLPLTPAVQASASLTDIDNSFAKEAIQELVDKGILNGTGDGKFDPTGNITRQDFAIILAKALHLDLSSPPAQATFSDVSSYALTYVEAAAQAGLIQGKGNGQFGGSDSLTREQMAVLFIRALGVDTTGKASLLTFSDKDSISSWAQDAVGAAVELNLIHGIGNNQFDPKGTAERQQVAVVSSLFLQANPQVKQPVQFTAAPVDSEIVAATFTNEVSGFSSSDFNLNVQATGASVKLVDVQLSPDKKTVTLRTSGLTSGTTYMLRYKDKTVEFTTAPMMVQYISRTKLTLQAGKIADNGTKPQISIKNKSTGDPVAVQNVEPSNTKRIVYNLLVDPLQPDTVYTLTFQDQSVDFKTKPLGAPVKLLLNPSSASTNALATFYFHVIKAYDSYEQEIPVDQLPAVQWTVSEGGSITQDGIFTFNEFNKTYTITATIGTVSQLATIVVGSRPSAPVVVKPVVSLVTSGTVTIGEPVKARSSQSGFLYLVSFDDSNGTQTLSTLNSLVDQGKAVKQTTAANQETALQTSSLSSGSYVVYAVNSSNMVSLPSDPVVVSEPAPTPVEEHPVVTLVSTGPVTVGQSVYASSSQAGYLYLISFDHSSDSQTAASLDQLVEQGNAVKQSAAANQETALQTTALSGGSYVVYAVNSSNRVSLPSDPVLVNLGDTRKPMLSNVTIILDTASSNVMVNATSDESGFVYLVSTDSSTSPTLSLLNQMVEDGLGYKVAATANEQVTFQPSPGYYYLFAVDASGNISEKTITIHV